MRHASTLDHSDWSELDYKVGNASIVTCLHYLHQSAHNCKSNLQFDLDFSFAAKLWKQHRQPHGTHEVSDQTLYLWTWSMYTLIGYTLIMSASAYLEDHSHASASSLPGSSYSTCEDQKHTIRVFWLTVQQRNMVRLYM